MIEAESPFDIEYRDSNLEKNLKLTPADLRFIDELISKVESSDETQWEGSDAWIRFKRHHLSQILTYSRSDHNSRNI